MTTASIFQGDAQPFFRTAMRFCLGRHEVHNNGFVIWTPLTGHCKGTFSATIQVLLLKEPFVTLRLLFSGIATYPCGKSKGVSCYGGGVANYCKQKNFAGFPPGETPPLVRKSVMSIKFPPAILGPEMAAPILWAPGIFWFFLLEKPPCP